eukprot:Gb_33585 [translate_table: standard]
MPPQQQQSSLSAQQPQTSLQQVQQPPVTYEGTPNIPSKLSNTVMTPYQEHVELDQELKDILNDTDKRSPSPLFINLNDITLHAWKIPWVPVGTSGCHLGMGRTHVGTLGVGIVAGLYPATWRHALSNPVYLLLECGSCIRYGIQCGCEICIEYFDWLRGFEVQIVMFGRESNKHKYGCASWLQLIDKTQVEFNDKWRNMSVSASGQGSREKVKTPKVKAVAAVPYSSVTPESTTPVLAIESSASATPDNLISPRNSTSGKTLSPR